MSVQKFLEAVSNDSAMKNDVIKAVNDAIVATAQKNGHQVSIDDLNSKNHLSMAAAACVSTTKTVVCTV